MAVQDRPLLGTPVGDILSRKSDMPDVFIGSSVEGLPIAKYLQLGLHRFASCTIWTQGVFGLSQIALDNLIGATKITDYAILVLTPDDLSMKRGVRRNHPRDNVILELGLFMGALGRERTFVVHNRDTPLNLPSDLAGITTATFSLGKHEDLQVALGPVCTLLESAISQRARETVLDSPMRGLLGTWICHWSPNDDSFPQICDRVVVERIEGDIVQASGIDDRYGNYDLAGQVTPAGVFTLYYKSNARRRGGVVILKLKVNPSNALTGFWYEYDADRQFYGGNTTWKKSRQARTSNSPNQRLQRTTGVGR